MENAQKIQSLLGGNPMIKNVLSNPEHMKNAQKMLQSPDVQKQIGGLISNPKVIQQASQVLSGLQQMNSIQSGGRRRRRRKSTKKRRRKRGGIRFGRSGNKQENEACTIKRMGSECDERLRCKRNKDPVTNSEKPYTCQRSAGAWNPHIGARVASGLVSIAKHTSGGRTRRKRRRKSRRRKKRSRRRRKSSKKRRRRKSRR